MLRRIRCRPGDVRVAVVRAEGKSFTAEESLRMGYITRLCQDREVLLEQALKLAEEIAVLSPLAVQGVKEVANYTRDNGFLQGLEYAAQRSAAVAPNENMVEAVAAFLEKRTSPLKGR